jgi:hypothetical protein
MPQRGDTVALRGSHFAANISNLLHYRFGASVAPDDASERLQGKALLSSRSRRQIEPSQRDLRKCRTRRIAMRTGKVFVLGAIMGAAVVWLWGREMKQYVEEKSSQVRAKAAEGVRAVEEKAGKALDRGGDVLRRVDAFVQDTKADVSEALRAGQEAIRTAPAAKNA